MRKRTIENCAVSGIPLDLLDVAAVTRKAARRTKLVTLRHSWPENATDGRVWDGINGAISSGARALLAADQRLDSVQVWSHRSQFIVREIERADVE